jgi:putative serine protease PepD
MNLMVCSVHRNLDPPHLEDRADHRFGGRLFPLHSAGSETPPADSRTKIHYGQCRGNMSNALPTKAAGSRHLLTAALILTALMFGAGAVAGDFIEEELNTMEVYERMAQSIVNITTEACEPDYFMCPVPPTGSGSGIILREDGIIVTNHHVISGAAAVRVSLGDGRQFEAEVIGSTPHHDISVLRIEPGETSLQPAVLGDSDTIQVGEKVLAIGNPFGLGQTLTVGVVSMTGRDVRNNGAVLRGLIQTDASINPGNSGGALFNSRGELIGMNTMILSPTGSNIGIGFAIPVNQIKRVTPGIIHAWGRWLGWALAILIVAWILRRITSPRLEGRKAA